jgi:hypothetical protein
MAGTVSCRPGPSPFVNDSLKGQQLAQTRHRLLKQGAVGRSTGFTLLWFPISRPTESDARRDMVDRLNQEGINLKGLAINYANATRERSGFSLLGVFATPRITLTADIIEVLEEPRLAGWPTEQVIPVDVDDVPQTGNLQNKNRYAVVIGIEQYRKDLPPVNFASHDAKVVKDYLTKRLGFAEENVVSLVNEHAAKSDIEKYLEYWLPEHVDHDSTVLVYYSGHGASNFKTHEGYILPFDGDPTYLDGTGYSLKRLYETLEKSPAKEVVVMLDSCFSGTGGRSVTSKGLRPVIVSLENPVLAGGKTVVLTASSGVQASSTYQTKSHGLLTYFLLKGLQGSADQNNDGTIDLGEVYRYVKPHVEAVARQEFNNEQTPQLLGSAAMLERTITLIGAPR